MPIPKGGNSRNHIPKSNNSPGGGGNTTPGQKKGNSTPKGRGGGSAISGRGGTRGIDSSFIKQQQALRQAKGYLTKGGKVAAQAGRSFQQPLNSIVPNGYRSNALTKGLGKSAIAGKATIGFKSLAVTGLAKIFLPVTTFLAVYLYDTDTAISTVPEWIRQPGEKQTVSEKTAQDYKGEPGKQYSFKFRVLPRPYGDWIEKTINPDASVHFAPYSNLNIHFRDRQNPGYEADGWDSLAGRAKSGSRRGTFYLEGDAVNRDGEPNSFSSLRYVITDVVKDFTGKVEFLEMIEIGTGLPYKGNSQVTNSSNTTNHSNASVETNSDNFPNSLPLSILDNTPNSPSFRKSSSVVKQANTKAPSSVPIPDTIPVRSNPSPIPVPLPVPSPPPESTPEKQKQKKERSQPELPKYISESFIRRADGTTEIIKQREATEEELRDINRRLTESNKVIEKDRQYRDFSSEDGTIRNKTFNERFNLDSSPPNIIEDRQKKNALDVTKDLLKPPSVDNDGNKDDNPPPTTDNPPPFIPPPLIQTPPDKCKGSCAGKNGVKLDNIAALLTGSGQAVDLALLNTINKKLGAQIPNGGISSGLSQMTRSLAFDRWLNLLNVALSFHNAMMLSTTVIDTVVAVFDNVLKSIGFEFKDVDGSSIGFSSVISSSIRSIITRVVPEKAYTAATSIWTRANRFINASANLLYSVRGVIDAGQDITETIGENVSLIGNALKKAGAVRENAYSWMPERIDHSSRLHRRLEKIGDVADAFEEISSDVLDLSEEISEMKESAKEFQKVRTETIDKREKEESNKKRTATATPEPTELDEIRGEVDKDGR